MREPKAGFDERVDHKRVIDGNQELFKTGTLKCGRKQTEGCIAMKIRYGIRLNFGI